MDSAPHLYVIAGVNGAGKSSIGGAVLRQQPGGSYYNPDEETRRLRLERPEATPAEVNAEAWQHGRALLERAIRERKDFAFETTLGGNTMTSLLIDAATKGFEVTVWFAGLASPELHIQRVAARVRAGGHDIPEKKIRQRWEGSRRNLVRLIPHLAELKVFDNSQEADPEAGRIPTPRLLLHMKGGKTIFATDLSECPGWAIPVMRAARDFESN